VQLVVVNTSKQLVLTDPFVLTQHFDTLLETNTILQDELNRTLHFQSDTENKRSVLRNLHPHQLIEKTQSFGSNELGHCCCCCMPSLDANGFKMAAPQQRGWLCSAFI
jgi:hypothetical protein